MGNRVDPEHTDPDDYSYTAEEYGREEYEPNPYDGTYSEE